MCLCKGSVHVYYIIHLESNIDIKLLMLDANYFIHHMELVQSLQDNREPPVTKLLGQLCRMLLSHYIKLGILTVVSTLNVRLFNNAATYELVDNF